MSATSRKGGPERGIRRAVRAVLLVVLALALSACWDESEPPPAALVFTETWTNDDGTVDNPADTSDIGNISSRYDAHGTRSSDDPFEPGPDPNRYRKDVAKCTAAIDEHKRNAIEVTVESGYPGYVCTLAATLTNDSPALADVSPAAIDHDPGVIVAEISDPSLPETVPPGASATRVFYVSVMQDAQQTETITFTIDLESSELPCKPLTRDNVPNDTILISRSGLCAMFYTANRASCGWSPATPYSWKFVVNRTLDDRTASLHAEFVGAGSVTVTQPDEANRRRLVFYVYTAEPDTLRGAYVTGLTQGSLFLAGTCDGFCGGVEVDQLPTGAADRCGDI